MIPTRKGLVPVGMPLPLFAHEERPGLRRRRKLILWPLFLVVAFLYGAMFALFPPSFVPPMLLPILIGGLLVIWALPVGGAVPVKTIYFLFFSFFITMGVWPVYLAVALPGIPWITLTRIFGIPLALILLFSTSVSKSFREEIASVLASTPLVGKFVIGFALIQLFSIFVSGSPYQSLEKFFISQIYWTTMFFAACFIFKKPGSITWWSYLFPLMILWVGFLALWEARIGQVPWANHIPWFLKIEDESVLRTLAGAYRTGTDIYRVHSIFTTSLGFAEYLSFATPFLIHFVMEGKRWWIRVVALALLPFVFYLLVLTDARLGNVGFMGSFIVYFGLWAIRRWRLNRDSILGPALTLAYPALLAAFAAATIFVGRLRVMIWGGGAQKFSTEARLAQMDGALPMIAKGPWGHGAGQGAETLGYTNSAGVLTIDSYYLTIALEYGVIGFILYYGMFLLGIGYGINGLMQTRQKELTYLLPLVVALSMFCVIKSVLSQQENHSLAFMMLGAVCALVWRARSERQTP